MSGPIDGGPGMRASADELEAYLAPDESLLDGVPGAVFDDGYRSTGSVGVTDRRVLFVADDGSYLDVAHDAVTSVRSRPRTAVTPSRAGLGTAAALGAVLAVFAAIGVLVLQSDLLAAGLASILLAVHVGGVAAAERVRRHGVDRRTLSRLPGTLGGRFDGRHPGRLDDSRSIAQATAGSADGGRELAILGVAVVGLSALVGLIALSGSLLVVPLSMSVLGGVGLTDYGIRRLRDPEAIEGGPRRERDVTIYLVDGRTVNLRVDGAGRFDRDLGALVRRTARRDASLELTGP